MFYESFIPETNAHFPWVRESKSLPYIKATGDAIRVVLETYLPAAGIGAPSPAATEPPAQ
jgi:hypothetical protein